LSRTAFRYGKPSAPGWYEQGSIGSPLSEGVFALSTLIIGIVTGVLGVAYIAYGRRQTKFVPLLAGVFLFAYPYFIDSLVWLCVAGMLLLAAPFVIDI
jgi:hypothetical protein